jgi:O-methyltransferase involved in polyketide biosynthesis
MSETASHTLSGVPETSLATLYWRAMESQRPDALIKDQKAEALVKSLVRTLRDQLPGAELVFDAFRWMVPLFRLFKPVRIFHFRLGELARGAHDAA